MKKGNKILKYKLQITDIQSIDMPKGAKILNLQAQFDNPNIWAMVDPQIETEQRWFQMFGTGHELSNSELDYIGTFHTRGGMLVFHVFEVAHHTTKKNEFVIPAVSGRSEQVCEHPINERRSDGFGAIICRLCGKIILESLPIIKI